MIMGPDGDLLAQGPLDKPASVSALLDPSAVTRVRKASPLVAAERKDYNARVFAQVAGWQLAPAPPQRKKKS